MITTDGANDFHLSRIAGQFVTIFDMSKNAMDARQIYGPFLLIRSQYVTNKGHNINANGTEAGWGKRGGLVAKFPGRTETRVQILMDL